MLRHYGTRTHRPAPRRRLIIEERLYKTTADMLRAMAQIRRHCRKIGAYNFNLFQNGYREVDGEKMPLLYFARSYTDKELTEAGFVPAEFYHDSKVQRDAGR